MFALAVQWAPRDDIIWGHDPPHPSRGQFTLGVSMRQAYRRFPGCGEHDQRSALPGAEGILPGGRTGLPLWVRRNAALLVAMTGITVASLRIAAQQPSEPADKYQWLQKVSGAGRRGWGKAGN